MIQTTTMIFLIRLIRCVPIFSLFSFLVPGDRVALKNYRICTILAVSKKHV